MEQKKQYEKPSDQKTNSFPRDTKNVRNIQNYGENKKSNEYQIPKCFHEIWDPKKKKRKIQKYNSLSTTPKYEWPYKWVTGVITPLIGVITPLITGRGPPCRNFGEFFCGMTGHGSHGEKFSLPLFLSRGSLVLKASHLGVFSNQGMMVRCEKDGGCVF